MSDSQNRVIKLSRPTSRPKVDVLRATLVEELDELRANIKHVCETCENGLENHPEDMREWLSALHSLNMECTTFYCAGFFSRASGILDLDHEN